MITPQQRDAASPVYASDEIAAVAQLDWHNDPPPRFFPDDARNAYARRWIDRLRLPLQVMTIGDPIRFVDVPAGAP